MKTIHTLALAAIVTLSAGIADAAPRGWDNGPRHHDSRYDNRHNDQRSGYRTPPHRGRYQSTETKAQLRLRELGYYRGRVDGQFGPASRNALVRFQRASRLPMTGRLDPRTLRVLRIL